MRSRLTKKGFTIVELVIVIAVIAVLAGVLIPTFSGVIKNANLSADKQAVREMNMALAADEAIHGRPANVEAAMKVLADAGYDADNWVCLTKGYEVYWYATDNRLVLYNANTAELEYPDNYDRKLMLDAATANNFYIYNQHHKKAVSVDTTLGSFGAGEKAKTIDVLASDASTTSSQTALSSASAALSTQASSNNSELKNALGLQSDDTAYVYATKEEIAGDANSNAYASMQVLSVGSTETPTDDELKSDGTLKQNLFIIQVNTNDNATEEEVAAAEKNAGDLVYSIFTQINTTQLASDVSVVFPAGTTIDVTGKEWAAVKEFSGYFGTEDAAHPLVIDGAVMSSATGFSQTVSFTGSSSKYFVTGFFGTVYGKTTIENVVFKNIKLDQPAMDFEISKESLNGKPIDSRNTIGVIGGVTDKALGRKADVTVRNVVVEDSVELVCGASGGGLIGYVGSADSSGKLDGKILIDNCHVSTYVHTDYVSTSGPGKANQYGVVGGLIGFVCRADNINIEIKDSIYDGTVEGTTCVGGCIGDIISIKTLKFTGNNSFENATVTAKGNFGYIGQITAHIPTLASMNQKMSLSAGATVSYLNDGKYALTIGTNHYQLTGTGDEFGFTLAN